MPTFSLREPLGLKQMTLNDELTQFNDSKWCIVSCAEKSLCPSVFIAIFFIIDAAVVVVWELWTILLKASLSKFDLDSLFAVYLSKY